MAYFIHNKYDKDSIAKVSTTNGVNYTYKEDNSVIVIDYYGQLQSGNNSYKDLDTTYMGISTVENLQYRVNTGTQTGTEDIINNLSNNEIKTSLFDILMDIVGKIGTVTDLNDSTLFGRLGSGTTVKQIARGSVASTDAYRTTNASGLTLSGKINLSISNPNKVLIFFDGTEYQPTYSISSSGIDYTRNQVNYSSSISTNITYNYTYGAGFEWQLVEFI